MHSFMLRFALGAAAAASLTPRTLAQADFHDAPEIYTRSPGIFTTLFNRATTQTVHALILGDSQETCPGGAGSAYIPRVQYEFWRRSGNAPATAWIPMRTSFGGGNVPSDWLHRTSNVTPGLTAPRVAPDFLPPNAAAGATSTTDGANVNANQLYGNMLLLEPSGEGLNPGSGIAGLTTFFDTSGDIYLDIMASTYPGSGEVLARVTPAPSQHINFFLPTTATFTTAMGLDALAGDVRVQRVGPLPLNGRPYPQVEISGTDPARLTDVIAARFVNASRPNGWVFTSFSAGGYTVPDIQYRHAQCGPILGAAEADVVFITYGANDCEPIFPTPLGTSPLNYKIQLQQLIAFVRSHTRVDMPIVLIADVYRSGLNPGALSYLDQYPYACYQLAQEDYLICAVNSRRMTDAAGWNAATATTYLTDGIHFTAAGAILKARVEADVLFGSFQASACVAPTVLSHPADAGPCLGGFVGFSLQVDATGTIQYLWRRNQEPIADGTTPWGSVIYGTQTPNLVIEQLAQQDDAIYDCVITNDCGTVTCIPATITSIACACDPDISQDGNTDQTDIDYLVNIIAGGDNPLNADPDFNLDGNVDQLDVDSLITRIAGGPCP